MRGGNPFFGQLIRDLFEIYSENHSKKANL